MKQLALWVSIALVISGLTLLIWGSWWSMRHGMLGARPGSMGYPFIFAILGVGYIGMGLIMSVIGLTYLRRRFRNRV